MVKKILSAALLGCWAVTTAHAQIATPNLDRGFHTFSAAATGWRYGSTISLDALSMKGDVKADDAPEGDVSAGMTADGPDDSGSIPHLLAAYKAGAFVAELYASTKNGINQDMEFDLVSGFPSTQALWPYIENIPYVETNETYIEDREVRLYLAYVFAESLSIGLGYHSAKFKEEETVKGPIIIDINPHPTEKLLTKGTFQKATETETTTTKLSLDSSWRIADIFYIAGGIESVKKTGTVEFEQIIKFTHPVSKTEQTASQSSGSGDYVENSWTNTNIGIGLLTGEPEGTQFKLELSMVNSPESAEKASDGDAASYHPKTTTTFITAEAKYNNFVLGVHREAEIEDKLEELKNQKTETTTTQIGLGWQPMEGLSLSLYSIAQKKTIKKPDMGQTATVVEEITIEPKGFRFFVGYNF